MVNISLPSTALFRGATQRRQRSTRSSTLIKRRPSLVTRARAAQQQQEKEKEEQEQADKENETNKDSATVPASDEAYFGGMQAPNSPWVVCRDHQGVPFWLNTATGYQTYGIVGNSGYSGLMQQQPQPPPSMMPPMMYYPQTPAPAPQFNQQGVALTTQNQLPAAAVAGLGGYALSGFVNASTTSEGAGSPEEVGETKRAVLGTVVEESENEGNKAEEESAEGCKKGRKSMWPKPAWEECYDENWKPVWIHTASKKLVHEDPYM